MIEPVVGSIVVISVLTDALLHSVCDSKVTQMSVQCRPIWELLFYEFELGHNTTEETKNICGTKGDC